ncbi:hypothetical protein EDB81DRAFT_874215 [Dactylonectria macrodidyma]|uniref:Uncharacterized protein n=1 Tax=Dactylonectria macrodidyma TaxID=307937 RepID=A0A9P9JIB3_9HYPO|nr:hypothetical protein EDB81DRAFT_874215 [Dactylonectria macrodidyma]
MEALPPSDKYPQYPNWLLASTSAADWETATVTYPDVKKYFHNSSSSCTSFDVGQFATWDGMCPYPKDNGKGYFYQQGVRYHGLYDTEHAFEGQTIGRFFDRWLPNSAQKARMHYWVEENFFLPNNKWGNKPLMKLLVDELGSINN